MPNPRPTDLEADVAAILDIDLERTMRGSITVERTLAGVVASWRGAMTLTAEQVAAVQALVNAEDARHNPVPSYSIAWAGPPESAATREATTRLVDATVPAMTAALQAAFDREIARARRPRATFVNHTDDDPCILDPDRTLT